MSIATLQLRNGEKMPVMGLGTWKLSNDVCAKTVKTALKIGYRLLDCACAYGNEVQVGEGLKQAISEGIVKREDVWVTSKLWNTFHSREHVKLACKRTLKDLGLDYVDLYLMHFPVSLKYVDFETRYPPDWNDPGKKSDVVDVPISETWAAMEELVTEGLVKNIGISNFNNQLIMDLMKYAKIKPNVLQVELHPFLHQNQLVNYCQRKEVHIPITAYSSFGSISYVPLGLKNAVDLLEHNVVKSIASKHKKTACQVLLRWAVQRGLAVIPKTTDENRLKENFSVFDFELDSKDMNDLKGLDNGTRYNDPGVDNDIPIFG